jgi:isoquinoline 1-oxidoreductase subunit beta
MKKNSDRLKCVDSDPEKQTEMLAYDFGLNRRSFVQFLGTGLLIAAGASSALAQRSGGRGGGGGSRKISARLHIGKDGVITLLTGKVEGGQGARTELLLAAAEELRLPAAQIQVVMADTSLVPDDGTTAGSRTTPSTVPAVRQGAAAARELLIDFASAQWNVDRTQVQVQDGKAVHKESQRTLTYADLASSGQGAKLLDKLVPSDVPLTPVKQWKVLGVSTARPNGRELVTGVHKFPSDITRPGMLYGKVLRAPGYGAKLISIDLQPAEAMKDVVVTREDPFVGVMAPTSFQARNALGAIARTAKWEFTKHPSSKEVFAYLKEHAQGDVAANPFQDERSQAKQVLRQTFHVPYVQHAPLEPRAAVAEWNEGRLTVWAGTQNPFGYRAELMRAFHLSEDQVRVIVPDFGGGFGGKHTGEAAIEAARLAQAAKRPVSLQWTRQEEFTWAYFRPAAVIEIEAGLNAEGALTSWHHLNINSGGAALETPYRTGKSRCRFIGSNSPLRQGSYRALAATANNFARECFMDELAAAAGADPLQFRLAHLDADRNARLRAVLETAATRFGWQECVAKKRPNIGVGLACGTEKGSYVACCVEIEIEQPQKQIVVRRVCEVFECGPVLNPGNLTAQVEGAILMALGPALREQMLFENGEVLNASFRKYLVPRFSDVPEMDIHLLNRTDLEAVGGGETPIMVVTPAIANALFQVSGNRVRQMPVVL